MDPNAVVEAFRHTVTEHYLDFAGRCARRAFWYYVLAYVVGYIVLAIVQSIFGVHILTTLYSLALLLPGIGISVRRLHDIDRSGWWILIGVVPSILMIVVSAMAFAAGAGGSAFLYAIFLPIITLGALALLIYWYAQPGTAGSNTYGPPPVDTSTPSTVT